MKDQGIGYIAMMHAEGWKVYTRNNATYCYCTDGIHICYAQWGGVTIGVSSVHRPNKCTGTGFQIADRITPETVREAMFAFAPSWASQRKRNSVCKYKDWNEFHNRDSFNKKLFEV